MARTDKVAEFSEGFATVEFVYRDNGDGLKVMTIWVRALSTILSPISSMARRWPIRAIWRSSLLLRSARTLPSHVRLLTMRISRIRAGALPYA